MTHEDSQTEKLVSEDAVDKRGWQQRRWRTDSTGKKGVREVQVLHPGLDVSVMSAKRRVTVFTPLDESSNWLSSDQLDICWSRSVGKPTLIFRTKSHTTGSCPVTPRQQQNSLCSPGAGVSWLSEWAL